MSAGPICQAIEDQFDAWDSQIEDLKNKTVEAAKEQAKKIKKDIKDYVAKKKEELNKQKDESDAKKEAFKVPDVPTDPKDIIDWANKVGAILTEIINVITAVVTDLAMAPSTLIKRANQSLSNLATPPSEQFEPVPEPEPEP